MYIYMYACISNPRIKPRSPTLQADSSPAEPQGKPCIFILGVEQMTNEDLLCSTGHLLSALW